MDYLYILSQFKMFPCFFIIYALIISYVHAFSHLQNFSKGTIFFYKEPNFWHFKSNFCYCNIYLVI